MMDFESIEQMIEHYEKLKSEELKKSFPFDFGVVESMQKVEDYEQFIQGLKKLQVQTPRSIELG